MAQPNSENWNGSGIGPTDPWSGVIAGAMAKEREACAKIAEDHEEERDGERAVCRSIAEAIRARTDIS